MMDALKLMQVDQQYQIHLQAWTSFLATSTKKSGKHSKPVYPRFTDFFDYEKEIRKVEKTKKKGRFDALSRYLKQQQKGQQNDG